MTDAIWLPPPNWGNELSLAEGWRTGILRRPTGAEQRSMLYTIPRSTLRYTPTTDDFSQRAWLTRYLHRYLHGLWAVPVWPDMTRLTAQAASGQAVLAVESTAYRRFYPGMGCILIDPADWSTVETGIIDTVTATQITLADNLSTTWSAALVYPTITARLSTSQTVQCVTARHAAIELVFDMFMAEASTLSATYAPMVDQYLGEDLFLIRPNWIEPVEMDYANAWRSLVYHGIGVADSLAAETTIRMRATWTGLERASIWALREFFMSRAGRFGRFWMPSWHEDVRVTAAFDSAAQTLAIADIDYAASWLPNDCTGRHLLFLFPDGTMACRWVSAAPTATTITLDSAIGTTVTAGELGRLRVCFLYFCRFDMDEIEFAHHCADAASAQLTMATIPHEAPEI